MARRLAEGVLRGRHQALKPLVALTFDDGPSRWTNSILDALATAEAKATFFVIGMYVREHSDLLRRMVSEGHEIGAHGWNHEPLDVMSNAMLRGQIMLTRHAILTACEYKPRRWRSPWGRTTDAARTEIQRAGLRVVGTGLNAYDCDRDPPSIVKTVVSQLRDETIVCLHDGVAPNAKHPDASRDATVRALPKILEACRSVTVGELLA